MKTLSGLAALLFAGVFVVGCSTTTTTTTRASTTTVRSVPSPVVQPSVEKTSPAPASLERVEEKKVEQDTPRYTGCGG